MLLVIPAAADQRDVTDLELEVVDVADPRDERVELRGRHIVNAPALVAHEMAVRAGEMEERSTVWLMHVFYESPIVQGVKCPVDGREVNFGMRAVHARGQLVGREMFARARQQLHHEATRSRDASPLRTQCIECSRLRPCSRLPYPLHGAHVVQLRGVRIWPELWI